MSGTPDIMKELQDEIRKELEAVEFFSNVPVITQERGDILNEVETALAKMGLCVVVEMFQGDVEYQGIGGAAIRLKTVFTITENVLMNQAAGGTGKTAGSAVVQILATFNPNRVNKSLPCWCNGFRLVNDTGGQLVYQIDATAQAGWAQTEQGA